MGTANTVAAALLAFGRRCTANHGRLVLGVWLLLTCNRALGGQVSEAGQSAEPAAEAASSPAAEQVDAPTDIKPRPFTSRAWGTRLETEPPGYVKSLSVHGKRYGLDRWRDLDWLDFGLEHRTRYEMRRDDYRSGRSATLPDENQFLLRSRMYVGVRDILDPFRFAVEVEDDRQCLSDFPERIDDVDELHILQAYGELHFADALGVGYPFEVRAGRMTLEYMDRRLAGRNRWRSTINAFDGIRFRLGEPAADWQLDVFAVQPVERRLHQRDRTDEQRWFYGVVGAWRGWSPTIVWEPYYFALDEDFKDPAARDRELHTLGLHGFGLIGQTGFDYDFNAALQMGHDGERDVCAYAFIGEVGRTFKHAWKPRLSFSSAYASGDADPDDQRSNRFDRLFGVGHSWSMNDLFDWRNTIAPKIRLEVRPHQRLRIDGAYGAYWLADRSDAWPRVGRRDPAGESGSFVGQEFELRARLQLAPQVELEAGYTHFMPGAFVRNTGPADDADLFYLMMTLTF